MVLWLLMPTSYKIVRVLAGISCIALLVTTLLTRHTSWEPDLWMELAPLGSMIMFMSAFIFLHYKKTGQIV